MFNLYIFDFDGTLGNTRRNIVITTQQTLSELQLPPRSEDDIAATIGLPLEECFRRLVDGATEELVADCAATYRRLFEQNRERMIPQTFPHVAETLEQLYTQGATLTVATSRGLLSAKQLLAGMGIEKYFEYVLGADSVTKHKPDPEPVLKTLADLGMQPSETIVVGDMPVDIMMGRAAGCTTCGVTYGNATREQLAAAGADYIVDDISDIPMP